MLAVINLHIGSPTVWMENNYNIQKHLGRQIKGERSRTIVAYHPFVKQHSFEIYNIMICVEQSMRCSKIGREQPYFINARLVIWMKSSLIAIVRNLPPTNMEQISIGCQELKEFIRIVHQRSQLSHKRNMRVIKQHKSCCH